MGFEFGLSKVDTGIYSVENTYWCCCGWDNVDFFKMFASLSDDEEAVRKIHITGDGKCKIKVEALSFLEELERKISNNTYYATITLLRTLNPGYADEYFVQLNRDELASLRLSFVLPNQSQDVRDIIAFLYEQFEAGYYTVDNLIEVYHQMKNDDAKEVILYGS